MRSLSYAMSCQEEEAAAGGVVICVLAAEAAARSRSRRKSSCRNEWHCAASDGVRRFTCVVCVGGANSALLTSSTRTNPLRVPTATRPACSGFGFALTYSSECWGRYSTVHSAHEYVTAQYLYTVLSTAQYQYFI